jgi:energy-coupling factor transporter ATP-binding protein EcfA2
MHPGLFRLLDEVKRRFEKAKRSNSGEALLAIISTGGGKSHFIRLLRTLMPNEQTPTHAIRRVVAFNVPPRPTQESMSQELLKAIGDPAWNQKAALEKPLDRAVRLLTGVETCVVCIDNVQDIPERRGAKGIRIVGNWIRDLWDKCTCLVLLLGTPAAKEIVWANPQLRRRSPARIEMKYFDIRSDTGAARFKRFLHEVDEQLPLAKTSCLGEMAARIFWATYGIPDYIFRLLGDAIEVAVASERESLVEDDLRIAFDRMMLDAGAGLNPFSTDGPKRPLDREGEPFFRWHEALNPATDDGPGPPVKKPRRRRHLD